MESLRALLELATAYQACRDEEALLETFASALGAQLKAEAVLVWLPIGDGFECRGRWSAPGARIEPARRAEPDGLVAQMAASPRPRRFSGVELEADALAHLDESDRERVRSALYAPLPAPAGRSGVVEALNNRGGQFTAEDAAWLEEAARLTVRALDRAFEADAERQEHLHTVERLTRLYDISRVFNSSLELEALLPLIAERMADALGARGVHLWLLEEGTGSLHLAQRAGSDPTTEEGARVAPGEGVLGAVARDGEPRLARTGADDPVLVARMEAGIGSLMCAPLSKGDEVLGVVEAVSGDERRPFDDDDLFFLGNLADQAAQALANANRLQAERKVHQLGALLAMSKEITSTLDLDRVLLGLVNQAGSVLPLDRCALALIDRGEMALQAVSGMDAVPRSPEMEALRRVLQWVAGQDEAVAADLTEEGWDVEPEAGRAVLPPYLEGCGYRGFFAVPLKDEEGVLGVLALESHEPEFLEESQIELLWILASQATVAIRNAQLYQQVPLIGVMQPLLESKKRLLALPRERLKRASRQAAAAIVLLIAVPWRLKTPAQAVVVPAERRTVTAEVAGVIQRVMVKEGSLVESGAVLAELDDGEGRLALERAQAALLSANRQLGEAEQKGDLAAASEARLAIEMAVAEAALCRDRIAKTRLRATIPGVVVTPKVEERTGEMLEKGARFCELVDDARLAVAMSVPETGIDLVAAGKPVSLKLNAFPTETFAGTVDRVAAQASPVEGRPYFTVRAVFANERLRARTGMIGRAKIVASGGWFGSGFYPIGYVLLRDLARWSWRSTWPWLP
jgi:GAF domain-containing protein